MLKKWLQSEAWKRSCLTQKVWRCVGFWNVTRNYLFHWHFIERATVDSLEVFTCFQRLRSLRSPWQRYVSAQRLKSCTDVANLLQAESPNKANSRGTYVESATFQQQTSHIRFMQVPLNPEKSPHPPTSYSILLTAYMYIAHIYHIVGILDRLPWVTRAKVRYIHTVYSIEYVWVRVCIWTLVTWQEDGNQ